MTPLLHSVTELPSFLYIRRAFAQDTSTKVYEVGIPLSVDEVS